MQKVLLKRFTQDDWTLLKSDEIIQGPVTKTENIKTDAAKILRPTRFLGPKDIKTDRIFVSLNL